MPFGIVLDTIRMFPTRVKLVRFTGMCRRLRQGVFGLIAALLIPLWSQAEIRYTDLKPDFRSGDQMGRYALDLDRNRKPDFAFWFLLPVSGESVALTTYKDHAVMGELRSGLVKPLWLQKDQEIGMQGAWAASTSTAVPLPEKTEIVAENATAYVGLRMDRNGAPPFWLGAGKLGCEHRQLPVVGFCLRNGGRKIDQGW